MYSTFIDSEIHYYEEEDYLETERDRAICPISLAYSSSTCLMWSSSVLMFDIDTFTKDKSPTPVILREDC